MWASQSKASRLDSSLEVYFAWACGTACEDDIEVEGSHVSGAISGEWILVGTVDASEDVIVLFALWYALGHIAYIVRSCTRFCCSAVEKKGVQVIVIAIASSFTRLAEMQDFAICTVSTTGVPRSHSQMVIKRPKTIARFVTAAPCRLCAGPVE